MSDDKPITIATAKVLLDRNFRVKHLSDAQGLLKASPLQIDISLLECWPDFGDWVTGYFQELAERNNFSLCVAGALASITDLGDQGLLLHVWRQLDVLKSSLTLLQFNTLIFDQNARLVFINEAANRFLQNQRVEDWMPLLPDEWHDGFEQWLNSDSPSEFEKEFNGQYLRWEISSDQNHLYLIMVCHPMLDRENYRRILEYSVDGIYQTSYTGELIYANNSLAQLFGYANPNEMKLHIQKVETDIYRYGEDRRRFLTQLREQGEVAGFECEMFDKLGNTVWVRQNARAVFDEQGRLEHIIGTVADMSAFKRSEQARLKAESSYRRLFNSAQAGLYQSTIGIKNESGETKAGARFLQVNQMFANMLGYYSPEHCIEQVTDIGQDVYADIRSRDILLKKIRQASVVSNERIQLKRFDGSLIWVVLNAQLLESHDRGILLIEGSIYDISNQVRAEKEIRFLAEHDALTQLPNRSRFQTQLLEYFDYWQQNPDHAFVVMFLDLDHFKDINDTLGHLVGDALLQEIARRLQQPLNAAYEAFRLGGDEFGILIDGDLNDHELEVVCQQLIARISQEFRYQDNILKVTASLGLVRSEQISLSDGESVLEVVMRAADLALYSCKRSGRASYQVYQESMRQQLLAEKDLEYRLELALKQEQLQLYFQPIFDASTERIIGAEALLRWPTDEGMISPGDFIPLAERCGLIADIDAWVIRKVVHYCRLLSKNHPDFNISFNLSAHHFNYDSFDTLFTPVADQMRRWGSNTTIELTERVMFEHTGKVIASLKMLRSLGVGISLDDFGTGYSSLSYLTQFPINKIKIDQGFIQKMETDTTAMAVVQAAVQIGKTLKLAINAEGVETETQCQYARSLGIDEIQGYYLAKPLPLSEVLQLLVAQQESDRNRSSV